MQNLKLTFLALHFPLLQELKLLSHQIKLTVQSAVCNKSVRGLPVVLCDQATPKNNK